MLLKLEHRVIGRYLFNLILPFHPDVSGFFAFVLDDRLKPFSQSSCRMVRPRADSWARTILSESFRTGLGIPSGTISVRSRERGSMHSCGFPNSSMVGSAVTLVLVRITKPPMLGRLATVVFQINDHFRPARSRLDLAALGRLKKVPRSSREVVFA
jgi:hypothetical protein